MILVEDKQLEALEERRLAQSQELEPPPTYSSLHPLPSSGASSIPKTVNYVSISRAHKPVDEAFIIDPSLFVPLFLRPQLSPGETEETRQHLRLECTYGHIRAHVTLVEKPEELVQSSKRTQRIFMKMKATNGGIAAKIHGGKHRHPFVLHAQAVNGNIRLHIPRTFRGPIVISHRHALVGFSDSVNRNLTTFGEVDGNRRSFLGDFTPYSRAEASDGWSGDELILKVRYGNVKIHYEDDAAGCTVKTRPNTLLNRFFGF